MNTQTQQQMPIPHFENRALLELLSCKNNNELWLLWLQMKLSKLDNSTYLGFVLNHNQNFESFIHDLYYGLLKLDRHAPNFENFYNERKNILAMTSINFPECYIYCENAQKLGKDCVYYLTDLSDEEKYTFMKIICEYDFSDDEILNAAKHSFPELALYLGSVEFQANDEISKFIRDYFTQYKFLKVRNKITPSFLQTVETLATSHLFYKLPTRSSLLTSIDPENSHLFFFDALSLDFLNYIMLKCKVRDLNFKCVICRCNLPSITAYNKEFTEKFNVHTISSLDELKHKSQRYNYETCNYPVYLFEELKIIDTELNRIHAQLLNGKIHNAVIVSDHGASRLALIYANQKPPAFELPEKAEHSGRCCKTNYAPKIPQIVFENGFAIITNYERFRGGKLSGLELHGGATLEEVVVPFIFISL